MANSDSWRDLAVSFQSVPQSYEFTATRLYFMELPTAEPIWYYPAPPEGLTELIVMARRGASKLAPPPTGDLTVAWLEALWKEATHGPVRVASEIIGKDRSGRLTNVRGKIDRVFQASYALCRKFESEALQAEFEERQRNDPKNWPPFRAEFEVFKKLRDMRSLPHEQVPEAFVRDAISRRLRIKPEEVTWKQIRHEVASLLDYYPAITLIPSTPQESPPAPDVQADQVQFPSERKIDPRLLRDSYLANFPDEKIKIRDLCWAAGQHYREWKRWLAGELKDGSTPDLAFRRVLMSGKRPKELSKKPRPNGWE